MVVGDCGFGGYGRRWNEVGVGCLLGDCWTRNYSRRGSWQMVGDLVVVGVGDYCFLVVSPSSSNCLLRVFGVGWVLLSVSWLGRATSFHR